MSSNDTNATPAAPAFRFREEGQGYTLAMLPITYSPVYYGFNCRPRQVKYYKVERSVEEIENGHVSRSNTVLFLAKLKSGYEKALAKLGEYEAESKRCDERRQNSSHSELREMYLKKRNAADTRAYNYSFKVRSLEDCVRRVEKLLADNPEKIV